MKISLPYPKLNIQNRKQVESGKAGRPYYLVLAYGFDPARSLFWLKRVKVGISAVHRKREIQIPNEGRHIWLDIDARPAYLKHNDANNKHFACPSC